MSNVFDNENNCDIKKVNNSLCCCEYYNENGIRSHLLTFCCNCEAIDQTFDRYLSFHLYWNCFQSIKSILRIIRCDSVPKSLLKSTIKTIKDRVRYPYCDGKGARTLDLEIVLPPIILSLLLIIASIGSIATLVSLFLLLPTIIYCVYKYYLNNKKLGETKFFLSWTISSLVLLM